MEQLRGEFQQVLPFLGQEELSLVGTPQFSLEQQEMHDLDRWKFVFVDDLADAEGLLKAEPRPIDMFDGPVNELVLESFRGGQADAIVLGGIRHGVLRRPEQWGILQGGIVISELAKFDHGTTVIRRLLPPWLRRGVLGLVDSYLELMIPAQRLIMAAYEVSVFSDRIALRLNSLS
ncbi:MAG: hypothetical protein KJ875_08125, partial [Alphaproteobacteria bacterium]|nr:hypothetical protein [Alphaproteobacteria bacterium]MBU2241046.1 hypothetical protein [Alphaproteobacteria bacterium]